jgi:hypothetical protein
MIDGNTIILSLFGIVVCFLQTLIFFSITDMRDRIVRLENTFIRHDGEERRGACDHG